MTNELILISAFLAGLAVNFDICPLAGDFAILSYIFNDAKSFKKTVLYAFSYAMGRITAYASLTLIIFIGFSRVSLSFFQEKGEIIIGVALIVFGLLNLKTDEHCCEHDSPRKPKNFFGSFLWGLLFSLGFCPHSAAIFFGIFIPSALSQPFNLLLPAAFGLGASSVIVFFSFLLSLNPTKAEKLLKKLEEKERAAKSLVALIFIAAGLIYLLK